MPLEVVRSVPAAPITRREETAPEVSTEDSRRLPVSRSSDPQKEERVIESVVMARPTRVPVPTPTAAAPIAIMPLTPRVTEPVLERVTDISPRTSPARVADTLREVGTAVETIRPQSSPSPTLDRPGDYVGAGSAFLTADNVEQQHTLPDAAPSPATNNVFASIAESMVVTPPSTNLGVDNTLSDTTFVVRTDRNKERLQGIQVLFGFERSKADQPEIKAPIWTDLSPRIYNSHTGKHLLCRLTAESGTEFAVSNRYFILVPEGHMNEPIVPGEPIVAPAPELVRLGP